MPVTRVGERSRLEAGLRSRCSGFQRVHHLSRCDRTNLFVSLDTSFPRPARVTRAVSLHLDMIGARCPVHAHIYWTLQINTSRRVRSSWSTVRPNPISCAGAVGHLLLEMLMVLFAHVALMLQLHSCCNRPVTHHLANNTIRKQDSGV